MKGDIFEAAGAPPIHPAPVRPGGGPPKGRLPGRSLQPTGDPLVDPCRVDPPALQDLPAAEGRRAFFTDWVQACSDSEGAGGLRDLRVAGLVRSGFRRICGNTCGARNRGANSDGKPASTRVDDGGGATCGAARTRRRPGHRDHPGRECRRTVCRAHRECPAPYWGCRPRRWQDARLRRRSQPLPAQAF